jgi:hypothetical protein
VKSTNQETFGVAWYCVISTHGTPVGHPSPALDEELTAREECFARGLQVAYGIKTAVMSQTTSMMILVLY